MAFAEKFRRTVALSSFAEQDLKDELDRREMARIEERDRQAKKTSKTVKVVCQLCGGVGGRETSEGYGQCFGCAGSGTSEAYLANSDEAAMPVDEEWLLSIGFTQDNEKGQVSLGVITILRYRQSVGSRIVAGPWRFYFDGVCGPDPLTRGHVRKMMEALEYAIPSCL